jgi:hypothetical protein
LLEELLVMNDTPKNIAAMFANNCRRDPALNEL